AAVNPSHGTLFTLTTFDEDQVAAVRALDEVAEAQGRRMVGVRFLTKSGEWRALQLTAISDYEEITINKIRSETGEYPPPLHEVLLERASVDPSVGLGDVAIGDVLTVEAPNGKQRQLRVAGTVHDMSQLPAFMSGAGYGYVTFETLAWLGEPRNFNQLDFTVAENALDFEHVTAVGRRVQQQLENAGQNVLFTFIPPPGEHPAQNFLDAFSLILGGIGALSLLLSGFLIVNTLSAILTQHVRQIGIMKAIGARTGQITVMYFVMVLLFGVLALLIAIPAGALGAIGL